ncbi:hypothetical protein ACP70R_011654 [Stipagrostis hirtigluma subsp. patula]
MRLFGQVIQAGHSMDLEATGGKRARASRGILAVDRLSALPDCLLHHIMSFMKARQVVQTCVLSTRWTHLWRSVLCLDVDQEEFMAADVMGPNYKEELDKFDDFAANLMCRYNVALLDSFRLHIRPSMFSCPSEIPASAWIRRAIKYCRPDPGAPAVAYMVLSVSRFRGGVLLNRMPSLDKASIRVWDNSAGLDQSKLAKDQLNLLDSVSNVTSLELSDFGTMVFGEESMTFPKFQNLRTLLLDNCDLSGNFQTVGNFLCNSPNLEMLTLRHCKFTKDYKKRKGQANVRKAFSSCRLNQMDFQCKNLKLTEIIIYEDDNVHKLVKLLLSISRHLPRNNIKITKADC